MGEALGGRGKRRHNIAQKHGGAKDCGGVKGDVKKAFTSTYIDVDLYVEQMDGYIEGGFLPDGRPKKVVYLEAGKGGALLKESSSLAIFSKRRTMRYSPVLVRKRVVVSNSPTLNR